jgi:hypothetical protein
MSWVRIPSAPLSNWKGILMLVEDTVIFKDIEAQLSEYTMKEVRQLRILSKYGEYITAGTVADSLRDIGKGDAASEVIDAAFLYETSLTPAGVA